MHMFEVLNKFCMHGWMKSSGARIKYLQVSTIRGKSFWVKVEQEYLINGVKC